MQIVRSNTQQIGPTPAMVDREQGIILLNDDTWDTLSKEQQTAILLHEMGHLQHGPEEKDADAFAFDAYTHGRGPGAAADFFDTFSQILQPDQHPEHKQRLMDLGSLAASQVHRQQGKDLPRKVIQRATRVHDQQQHSLLQPHGDAFWGWLVSGRQKKLQAEYRQIKNDQASQAWDQRTQGLITRSAPPLSGAQRQALYLEAMALYRRDPSRSPNQYYSALTEQYYKANTTQVKPTVSYYVPDEQGVYHESTTADLSGAFRVIGTAPKKAADYFLYLLVAALVIALGAFLLKKFRR